jgi:hypothetical protein
VSRFVVVFGTSHRLTGAEKAFRNIPDPNYPKLVEGLMSDKGLDFIFEEAAGLGPTTAEQLAHTRWGKNHYLDVDPFPDERPKHGIPKETHECFAIDPANSEDSACWELLDVHIKREELWLQRMKGTDFSRALMICGIAHMLSFSFRLRADGFDVEALSYEPQHIQQP